MTTVEDLVDQVRADVVGWRRHLHQNPELSFQEEQTARFVAETLESFSGIEVSRPTRTSVMGRLPGARVVLVDCGLTGEAKALAEYLARREKDAVLTAADEFQVK